MSGASHSSFQIDAARSVNEMVASLHHAFGDNDIIVARRQLRNATGDALLRWTEIVEKLEVRRG